MNVTINFGLGNQLTKNVPTGTTVGQLLGDANIKAVLGFGDNVRATIDGVPQPATAQLSDGDDVHVETNVGTKA